LVRKIYRFIPAGQITRPFQANIIDHTIIQLTLPVWGGKLQLSLDEKNGAGQSTVGEFEETLNALLDAEGGSRKRQ
jgi:hypothetical protein